MPNPKELGTMLVEAGKISHDQLTQALSLIEKNKGRLMAAAREMAENILSCDQTSVRKIKRMIDKGMKDLEAGLMFEKLEARNWYEQIEMEGVERRWPAIQERGKSQARKKATHD